jgi:hypothetical protein
VTSPERSAAWKFPAFGPGGKQVWLRAARTSYVPATRIVHHAVMQLGLPQKVTEAYQVRLRRGSTRPEDTLWAEGAETLEESERPRAKRGGSKGFQPIFC